MPFARAGRIPPVWHVPTRLIPPREAGTIWPVRLERYYLSFVMVLFNSIPFLVGGQPDGVDSLNPLNEVATATSQGDASKQAILLGLYALSSVLLVTRVRVRVTLCLGLPLLCLLLWCFASVGWSGAPAITLRRCIAVLGTVVLAVHYAARFDLDRMLTMLSNAFYTLLLLSVVVALILPMRGFDMEGRFRGVLEGKNAIGAYSALTILFFLSRLFCQPDRDPWARLYRLSGVCLGLVSLAWSHSASPIPALALACVALFGARVLRDMRGLSLALLPAIVAMALVLFGLAAAILAGGEGAAVLGRDSDLSGRTTVWAFTIKMILQHPLVGYGYQTFWEAGDQSSPAQVFWSLARIAVRHSHDGYLQLTLDLGVVGLGLLLAAIGVMFRRLVWLLRRPANRSALWVVGLMAFGMLENAVETRLWVGNEILTLLLSFAVTRVNIDYRLRRAAAGTARLPGPAPVRQPFEET